MITHKVIALISALLLLSACGESEAPTDDVNNSNEAGGKSDATDGEGLHAEWYGDLLADCQGEQHFGLNESSSTAESLEIISKYDVCLRDATDLALPYVEDAYSAADPADAERYEDGVDVREVYRNYVTARQELCSTVIPAFELGQGTMGTIFVASCQANAELEFGRLLATWIDELADTRDFVLVSGPVNVTIEQYRESAPTCFSAYDAAVAEMQQYEQIQEAHWAVQDCLGVLLPTYADAVAEGLTEYGYQENSDEAAQRYLDAQFAMSSAAEKLCHVVSSSANGASEYSDMYYDECLAQQGLLTDSLVHTYKAGF